MAHPLDGLLADLDKLADQVHAIIVQDEMVDPTVTVSTPETSATTTPLPEPEIDRRSH